MSSAEPQSSSPTPTVTLRVSGEQPRTLTVTENRAVTVGRDAGCQIRIETDPGVSRFHCRFEISPPRCQVVDVGSRNGTFLNGVRTPQSSVSNGDIVRCGATEITIEITDRSDADPASTIVVDRNLQGLPAALGGYSVVKEIGRGAMGRVLLARHPVSGRQAAIKIVTPELAADPKQLALFIREAAVLSRLRHPRIVDVLDFGIQDEWPYLVMEYVPVAPLDEFLQSPDRIRIACRIACLVLEGLEFAHSQGYVHRDVKPTNLLAFRGREGKLHIKLADFGLAKSFENAGLSGMTGSRETRGTIVFMPPEQLLDSRSAGPSSDIYSTGATLYRLLTGSAPYDAVTLSEALSAILNSDPVPIRTRNARISPDLAAVVHRAMSRNPADRYSSASEMKMALQAFGKRKK